MKQMKNKTTLTPSQSHGPLGIGGYRKALMAAAAAAGLSVPSVAHAANATWNGTTDSLWSTSTNWSAATPGVGNTATFSNAGNGNTTITVGTISLSQISFGTASAAAYTLGSGTITTADGTTTAGDMLSAVVNNEIVNTNFVLGTAVLSNTTFQNASLTNTLTLGGNITGGTGGTAAAKTLTLGGSGNGTFSGSLSNGGATSMALTKSGAGTWILSGSSSYTGATTISANAGALRITNSNALGSTAGATSVNSGAALELSNNITIGAEGLTISTGGLGNSGGGALVNVSGNNSYAGNISGIANGGYYSNSGTLTLSGAVEANSTGGTKFSGAGNFDLTGTATLGNFQKFGSGTLTLSSANTVTAGSTPTILGGTVRINSASHGISASTIALLNVSAGMFDLNGNSATITALSLGTRPTAMPSSFVQDNTTATVSTGSGTLSVTVGFVYSSANSIYTPALVASGSAGAISGNLDLGSVTHAWEINGTTVANSALTVSANITGTALTSVIAIDHSKGIGTLVLSGSNSFNGQTKNALGTLVLDYGTNNNSKLATGSLLTLGGLGTATLTLKDGSFAQSVTGLTIGTKNDVYINRNGGTSTLSVGTLTANGVLNIASDSLVATSTGLTNNILSNVFVNGTIATKSGSNIVAMTTWDQNPGASGTVNDSSTQNVRITAAGGTVTTGAAATSINTLTNGATSGGTTTVDIGTSGRTLTVSNGIVSGPGATALTINGTGGGTLASSLFVNNSSNAITVNANTTSAAISKSGTGLLVLNGSGASTTALNVLNGTVRVDNANALGSAGAIYMGDRSAVLQYGSGITTDYSARLTSFSNVAPVSIDTNGNNVTFATKVAGLVQKYGSGTLTLTGAANNMVSIYGGTLSLGHATDTLGGVVEVLGGTLDVANNDTVGAVFLKSGTISGAATLTGTSYTLTDTGTISANLGSNTATLQKLGAGTAVLSGSNAYTGITTVTQGVLKLGSANALPGGIASTGGTSALTINGGVVGLANGNFARGLGLGVTAVQILDAGGGFAAYSADRTVNLGGASAPVTWGSGSFMTSSNPGNLIGQGTFVLGAADADGMVDFQNPIALAAAGVQATDWWVGSRTIQANNGSANVDGKLSGIISNGSGSQSITKTGTGTLELTAANTYTGGTTVSVGRLLVNNSTGSGTGTGTVTVASGATLGGTGSIAGALNISGTVAPGASIQSLASGAATFNSGSVLAQEVDSSVATSSGADLLTVTGNLSLSGTVTLTLTDLAGSPVQFAGGTTFTVINYTGAWNNGVFTINGNTVADGGQFAVGLNTWLLDYNATSGGANFTGDQVAGNFVNITSVVPEPGTFCMLGASMIGGLLSRRRRKA